jgi:uncharacterized membrane protein
MLRIQYFFFSFNLWHQPVIISYFLIHIDSNLHQMKRQARLQTVATTHQTQMRRRKKRRTDRTILRILLWFKYSSLSFFSMPVFAFRMYTTLSSTMPKSNVRLSVENFIFNVTLMTFYFEKVCSFYI